MPIKPGPFEKDWAGESNLAIWMEYDQEYDYFVGSLRLGPAPHHIEALRYQEEEDLWNVGGESSPADVFICDKRDGDRPVRFRIMGFDGEWVCVAYPYG